MRYREKGSKTKESGFNHGRLFLIPKDDSYKVLSTRPIVIANADNRLVAKVMTTVMTPAAQAIIHPSQKGFVQGRVGSENIIELSELFYANLQHRQQIHILQIDTRKAFDSLDHSFIHLCLEKVGFPVWLLNIVHLLLTDVFVIPVVSAHTAVLIPIRRGVKQGCPLSPLLFVLAYDPLLWYIHDATNDDHDPSTFAFADDLAITASTLLTIFLCMSLIDTFARVSGLGVNEDKSRLTSSRTYSQGERVLLSSSPWTEVKVTNRITYLGVIIGRGVTTDLVFEKTLTKLSHRARLYAPIIKALPLHHKIVAVNIFLLSLFSYLIQFYIPGSIVTDRYNSIVGPIVGPFRGTALGLVHLFASPRAGLYGLHTPLKNLWAWSLSTLANKYDLPSLHHTSDYTLPGFAILEDPRWESMRIPVHIAGAARDLANHFLRNSEGVIVSNHLPPDCPETRTKLYHLAIELELSPVILHPTNKGSLCQRLQRWGLGSVGDAERLRTRWTLHKRSLPTHYYSHHLLMVFWALPTDERISKCDGLTVHDSRSPPFYNSCYLCSTFSVHSPMDSISHLYDGTCVVAASARNRFFSLLHLPPTFTMAHSLLLSTDRLPSLMASRSLYFHAVLFFNLHLYSLRARLFKPLPSPPPIESSVKILTAALVLAWNTSSWRSQTHPALLLSTSSSSRSAPRRLPPRLVPIVHVDPIDAIAPPPGSLLFYTDGSASPNPGPSGAGVVLIVDNVIKELFSVPIGPGTNNIAELYAFGLALERADELVDVSHGLGSPVPRHVFILSDSSLVIGLVTKGHRLRPHPVLTPLLATVKQRWRDLADRVLLTVLKIKGHAGLRGNVAADAQADRASLLSSEADSWRLTHCQTASFYRPP